MKKKYIISITLTVSLVVLFFQTNIIAKTTTRYDDLKNFTKVLNLVQNFYVDKVDINKIIYGGIKGMLNELDPHTNFLSKEVFKEFETETSGRFGGLGIEITIKKDVLTVISPIEDTPAWKAGIKSGDRIVKINGHSTKGLSLAESAKLMRGKNGSVVKLTIYRESFDEPKDFNVKRGIVNLKSAKYLNLKDGYAYIRLTSFMENTYKEFLKSIKKHRKTTKNHKIKGLILDLRQNPGGLLDQAIKISDLFLDKGIIVSTIGRKEKEHFYAKKSKTLENFPMIVLINEYSASASEIVAGALQDNKRALIMGQTSFGKGSVQSVIKLDDGSGLKLTVARYYTPSGKSIQAKGVVPDILVEDLVRKEFTNYSDKKIRREKDIKGHLLSEDEKKKIKTKKGFHIWWEDNQKNKKLSKVEKMLKDDFQVSQAYNYIKAWKVMKTF